MIYTMITLILILVLTLIVLMLILTFFKTHRLIVRDPMNKQHYIRSYWVNEIVDSKTKVTYWKSVWFQGKFMHEKPPAEAISTYNRGKKFAECYIITNDQIVWITDKGIDLKEEKDENGHIIYSIVNKVNNKVISNFEPFSSTQRAALVEQFAKADEISKKGKWGFNEILSFTALLILGGVVVCGIVFGGDILKGINTIQNSQTQGLGTMNEMLGNLNNMAREMGVKVTPVQTTQTPPIAQPSNLIVKSDNTPPKE